MRYLLVILTLMLTTSAQADMAVVVSKQSSVEKLNKREVANIFLSKTNRLSNGDRVKTIELSDKSSKKIFYEAISGKTLPQIYSYWTTLIFTGKGKPPRNIEHIGRLLEVLKTDKNAVAYIPVDQVTDSIRVVYVVHTQH